MCFGELSSCPRQVYPHQPTRSHAGDAACLARMHLGAHRYTPPRALLVDQSCSADLCMPCLDAAHWVSWGKQRGRTALAAFILPLPSISLKACLMTRSRVPRQAGRCHGSGEAGAFQLLPAPHAMGQKWVCQAEGAVDRRACAPRAHGLSC